MIFVTLSKAGSFARTARQLGLARSTVMRRMDALEAELGLTLIQRAGKRVVLTETGQRYAKALRPVLQELHRIEQHIQGETHSPSGHFRIWFPILGTSDDLIPAIAAFQQAYPDVIIHLELGRDIRQLELGEFDVAFQTSFRVNPNLATRTIYHEHMILVASQEYVEEYGLPKSVDDFPQHRAIYERDVEGKLQAWRTSTGSRLRMPPMSVEVNSIGFAFDLARHGAGIARAPSLLAAPYLASGEMIRILPAHSIRIPISFVFLPNPTPTTRAFLDFLSEWAHQKSQSLTPSDENHARLSST